MEIEENQTKSNVQEKSYSMFIARMVTFITYAFLCLVIIHYLGVESDIQCYA